jgi:hypothetical protein
MLADYARKYLLSGESARNHDALRPGSVVLKNDNPPISNEGCLDHDSSYGASVPR